MGTTIKKLTYTDFMKFPEDGNRHEIIEGEEYMTPPPTPAHQRAVLKLARILSDHTDEKGLGTVFVSPVGVVLSPHDTVQPDVLFIEKARMSIVRDDKIEGAPALVIEVLSPSTAEHDRHEKLALYQKSGVREYWLVDPSTQAIEIREFGSPRRTRVYRADQSFESSILPSLTIRLSDLF